MLPMRATRAAWRRGVTSVEAPMHSEAHHARMFFLAALLALLALVLFARPVHSAWSADPVAVSGGVVLEARVAVIR